MDVKELAARPSLEQYRKLAKEFLKGLRAGKAEPLEGLREFHPRFRKVPVSKIKVGELRLADAQLVVARGHGFESWPKFVAAVEGIAKRNSPGSRFEEAVEAIVAGDVAKFRELLRLEPGLIRARSARTHRATLLHYVGANGVEDYRQKTPKNAVDVAEVLLRAGAEVDAMADMYGGATTLGLIATSEHPFRAGVQNELIDKFLEHGAQLNHPTSAGNGQMIVNGCLANGRPEAAEHLAKRGAQLDLEGACGVGWLEVVESFFKANGELKEKADVERAKSGFNWACAYGRTEAVKFLLGTKVELGGIHRGETALHWAAYGGKAEIVDLIVRRGLPLNVKDERFDGTPLGWALYAWVGAKEGEAREVYYPIVEILVKAGAKIEREWLNEEERGYPMEKRIREDGRMWKLVCSMVELRQD